MKTTNGWEEANKLQMANYEEDGRMVAEAEAVKQMLNLCSVLPGAKITISVEHTNGCKATANLYDLAALVQSLHDALDYFQSETTIHTDDN